MSRDEAIRVALKGVIDGAVTTAAVVLDFWAVGLMLDEWPSMLRPNQGAVVHGYMMQWVNFTQNAVTAEGSQASALYRITGLYSHTGRVAVNEFGDNLEAIAYDLRPASLTVSTYGEIEHDGLQWESIDSVPFNNVLYQQARGSIVFNYRIC